MKRIDWTKLACKWGLHDWLWYPGNRLRCSRCEKTVEDLP